jgi:hypothetical protein
VITRISTTVVEERAAVDHIARQVPNRSDFTVLFCSPGYDLARIGSALQRVGMRQVIGASASRVIGADGVLASGITGFQLPGSRFRVADNLIENVAGFAPPDVREAVKLLRARLNVEGNCPPSHLFGMLLVDSEARCEERLIASLGIELAGIPIAGGSSGDVYFNPSGSGSPAPHILHGGRAYKGAAVFCLIASDQPVRALSHNHYIPGRRRVVITAADPSKRMVLEINGYPAREGYASACGLKNHPRLSSDFASYPLMIRIGGEYFARGVQRVNDDGSLEFACAMEPGMVLTVARSGDMVQRLQKMFEMCEPVFGAPELIIAFECSARVADMERRGLTREISSLFRQNSVVGFATLGEQYNTIHANNSFTCLWLPAAVK